MRRKSTVLEFRRPRHRFVAPGPVRGNKLRFSHERSARARVRGPAAGLALWTAACLSLFVGVMVWEWQAPPSLSITPMASASARAAPEPVVPEARFVPDAVAEPFPVASSTQVSRSVAVRWVDGDSGYVDGRAFRLYGVDAPEGSPSRAQCAREQKLSAHAGAAARALTQSGDVRVRGMMGVDKYGRELLLLSVDGRDVASALVGKGHLQYWAYESGQRKPDWCA